MSRNKRVNLARDNSVHYEQCGISYKPHITLYNLERRTSTSPSANFELVTQSCNLTALTISLQKIKSSRDYRIKELIYRATNETELVFSVVRLKYKLIKSRIIIKHAGG